MPVILTGELSADNQRTGGGTVPIVQKGDSISFVFDRDGETIAGWTCRVQVVRFPETGPAIDKLLDANGSGTAWEGKLSSTETDNLDSLGMWRLIGLIRNDSTNEEEQKPLRFNLTETWA